MKLVIECVCCLFLSIEVVAMGFPTVAFSENEGEALSKYHSWITDPEMGFKYFMPRTEGELAALYNSYMLGEISTSCMSPTEEIWSSVSGNILYEFLYRCIDCNKSVTDEYISYFGTFVKIVENFQDQSFLEVLYGGTSYGLGDSLIRFIGCVESTIEKHPGLTRESTYLLHTICEVDKILSTSSNFKDVELAEYYKQCYLKRDEFIESPEYQAMYGAISGAFAEGVSLTDLVSKK
jgi:hypothetical protein